MMADDSVQLGGRIQAHLKSEKWMVNWVVVIPSVLVIHDIIGQFLDQSWIAWEIVILVPLAIVGVYLSVVHLIAYFKTHFRRHYFLVAAILLPLWFFGRGYSTLWLGDVLFIKFYQEKLEMAASMTDEQCEASGILSELKVIKVDRTPEFTAYVKSGFLGKESGIMKVTSDKLPELGSEINGCDLIFLRKIYGDWYAFGST